MWHKYYPSSLHFLVLKFLVTIEKRGVSLDVFVKLQVSGKYLSTNILRVVNIADKHKKMLPQ